MIREAKDRWPRIGLARLCRLLGITRQAYYQHFWAVSDLTTGQQLILQQVAALRQSHPLMGGRKLYYLLQPFLQEHQLKIGRDAFFDLLAVRGLLVSKRKRSAVTTQSRHWLKKYPNLVRNWRPCRPGQLWVADITYVPAVNGFLYLSLVTDAYSHQIMGFHIADDLKSIHTLKALQMALQNTSGPLDQLIHHSDRGLQYCSRDYTGLLTAHQIKISMTESGDPLENAVAERINGIIKQEYLHHYRLSTCRQALPILETVVYRYNHQRPHLSINLLTPAVVHRQALQVNKTWTKKQKTNIVMQNQDRL